MTTIWKVGIAALGVIVLAASAPASATTTFATYNPVPKAGGPDNNVKLDGTSSSGILSSIGATGSSVIFDYTYGAPLIALGDLQAKLIMTASETPFGGSGAPLAYFDGSLSLVYDGATKTVGGITLTKGVTNLLTDTFTGALFSASGSAATLADSDFTGTVAFTSDLATFDPTLDQNFTVGVTSATPPLSFYPSGYLRSFKGVSQGEFAATVTGTSGGGGVPEPATWALMLIGFVGVGVATRGRARRANAA